VFLLQSLVHGDEGPKRFQEEVAAGKTEDTERLYAMELSQIKEAPTVWWRLLDRRNAKWIPEKRSRDQFSKTDDGCGRRAPLLRFPTA